MSTIIEVYKIIVKLFYELFLIIFRYLPLSPDPDPVTMFELKSQVRENV